MGTIFSADIQKFVEKAKGNVDAVIRKVSFSLFTKVVITSPVDTGRFKGNWQPSINSIPAGTLDTTDKSGAATIARIEAVTLQAKAGDVIYLISNLPYAVRLEYGHSKQEAGGMERLAET